ncbi:MAG TPA: protease pro-enzyme activation domain-containing protein [Candidatus Polarisedimenticolia bacterium]|nr:protease pro-enzyme activation domain-containing protein [Candidatus Polarisedimenticolia bacterium]
MIRPVCRRSRLPWLIALTAILATPALGGGPGKIAVRHNTPPGLAEAIFLRHADANLPIYVTLSLDLRDRVGAEALTAAQHDPLSSQYNKWISPEEFQARFGPRPEDLQAARDFLQSNGFTRIETPASRMVAGWGTVGLARAAFGVNINSYLYRGREAYANDTDPVLPPGLASKVVRVGGLDSLTQQQPMYRSSGGTLYYTHRDWAKAYNETPTFNAGFKATPGATIAIAGAYQVETPLLNDIFAREGGSVQGYNSWTDGASGPRTLFQGANGPTDNPPGTCLVLASVQGSKGCTLQNGTSGDSLEAQLDSVMVASTANDAHIVNYMVNNLQVDSFATMYQYIADHAADIKVVSTSWGLCVGQTPDSTIANEDAAFLQADAAGQAWFASSGDRGSNSCGGAPDPDTTWPSSSSHVTAAGGSDMNDNFGADGFTQGYAPETACVDGGGGVPSKSGSIYDRPAWQTGPGVPAGTKRVVPDISAHYGRCGTETNAGYAVTLGSFIYLTSGTSAVAPMWAGAWAVGNQVVGQNMGHAAPILYRILRDEAGTSYAASFHDVTTGNNGAYSAGPGYDPVTGIGTPDWGGLYSDLQTLFTVTVGDLQGTVTDAVTAAPIAGATVGTSGAGSNTTTTDGSGHYMFAGITTGTYSVTVAASGYATATASGVVVTDGGTTTRDFALAASPPSGCLLDTTQGDFQAGTATGLDPTSSPGDVKLAIASGGTETLDQVQTNLGSSGNAITTSVWEAQTFVPALGGSLTRLEAVLFCSACSGTDPAVTVDIRTTSGGSPTGTILATTTIPGFSSGGAVLYPAVFSSPATLTAGTTYAYVLRLATDRAAGTYAALRSNNNQYGSGAQLVSTNSGSTWSAQSTDLGFRTFMTTQVTYVASGDLVSSVKDANPVPGGTPHWTSLSWTATAPAGTTVRFQAAASAGPSGPFSFIGPDGTAGTFFTTSPAALSGALFSGRYFKYRAYLSTTVGTTTPVLGDVTACYDNTCLGLPDGTVCDDGNVCTGPDTCLAGACQGAPAPLDEVSPVLFSSQVAFDWPVTGGATYWNSYRGTIPAGLFGSRSPVAPYDQICYEGADALMDGPTTSTDVSDPPPGTAYYYLVTGVGACGEGPLGTQPSGQPIPNTSPCPTPP